MAGRTQNVKQWIWVDHSLPVWRSMPRLANNLEIFKTTFLSDKKLGHQVLVTEEAALIISNTVAVALALTLPRLLIFLKLLLPRRRVVSRPPPNGISAPPPTRDKGYAPNAMRTHPKHRKVL